MTSFNDAPVEVQAAIINAAGLVAAAALSTGGKNSYDSHHTHFEREFRKICATIEEQCIK